MQSLQQQEEQCKSFCKNLRLVGRFWTFPILYADGSHWAGYSTPHRVWEALLKFPRYLMFATHDAFGLRHAGFLKSDESYRHDIADNEVFEVFTYINKVT